MWLGDPHFALYAVIVANIFQWMGAQMVFYIAGLSAIPDEYFEAAQMDGAGFWQTLFRILMPLLWPSHTIVITLGIIGSVKTFDLVWLMTFGGPANSSHLPATFLYKVATEQFKAGYGASVGVIMVVICVALSLVQNRIYQKSRVLM
jgi:raffinose/stachyose/melibiose transport system permease protein